MVKIYVQEACLKHQYIRSKDLSNIVERPERLRAVNVGIAAVLARTSEVSSQPSATAEPVKAEKEEDDLVQAIGRLDITQAGPSGLKTGAVEVIKSSAKLNILDHAAVKYIHGDIEGDVYLETLKRWIHESHDKVSQGGSEIPEGYNQGDLYRECRVSMVTYMRSYPL